MKTQPANAEPPPPADGSGSAHARGTCEAAGGSCMHMTAAIACATKPEGTCQPDHFCCGM